MKRSFANKRLNHVKKITKEEAYALFEGYGVSGSHGDIICDHCSNDLRNIISRKKVISSRETDLFEYSDRWYERDFSPLGTSSWLKILDICKGSTKRSFSGIDYYTADVGETFDNIIKMVEKIELKNSKYKNVIDNYRLVEKF